VTQVPLRPEDDWRLDPAELDRAVRSGTKLIVVTNPNNPTGRVLSPTEREAIVASADTVGAWLLADEVYQGAERSGVTTESFWGSYERTIVVNGLSKAYGLPGLRIGWLVAPPEFKDAVYQRHDYTVICPTVLSDYLARCALRARSKILARTRGILNENYPVLAGWLEQFGHRMGWREPDCGAICFVNYRGALEALDLAERIREEESILLEPGEHFGLPRSLRMGYGNAPAEFRQALEALGPPLRRLLQA